MLVVIPRFCPAVQMKIDFLYAEIMNFADLLLAHGKRHYAVIFLRILRIEKAGLRLHNRQSSFVISALLSNEMYFLAYHLLM